MLFQIKNEQDEYEKTAAFQPFQHSVAGNVLFVHLIFNKQLGLNEDDEEDIFRMMEFKIYKSFKQFDATLRCAGVPSRFIRKIFITRSTKPKMCTYESLSPLLKASLHAKIPHKLEEGQENIVGSMASVSKK